MRTGRHELKNQETGGLREETAELNTALSMRSSFLAETDSTLWSFESNTVH